ncbi:MAG: antA/AntB antirepressor family protein [Gammaproteobacteria bacterium]|nr:antA/AntB antirepressor family protein [Gammaproteobacteria bacterium]
MTNPIQPLAVSAICIPTTNAELNGDNQPLVNARDLHDFLEVGRDYNTWIKSRISDYQFTENLDYMEFSPKLGKTPIFGGRPKKDYLITLDMAKELAMVERNDKGRQARRYFIEMEKRTLADTKQAIAEQQSWVIDDLQDAYLSVHPQHAKLVRYYATGMLSNSEIGTLLGINPSTVRYHLTKLNRLGLVKYPRPDDYAQSDNGQMALALDGGAK